MDVVVSSEAIEHTAEPERAVSELYRVLKPGWYLVLSTPNRLWQGPVRIASAIGWRPYDGTRISSGPASYAGSSSGKGVA